MKNILICCLVSATVSIITNRIVTIHYLNVIDSYKREITELIKELVRTANIHK